MKNVFTCVLLTAGLLLAVLGNSQPALADNGTGANYYLIYDFEDYLSYNPDVEAAFGRDPEMVYAHFIQYGMNEGRRAKSTFEVRAYRKYYPDLDQAFGDDWAAYFRHYMTFGVKEGRNKLTSDLVQPDPSVSWKDDLSLVFDSSFYTSKYADLRAAFGNNGILARQHFLTYGMKEHRQAISSFNPVYYRDRYADLQSAFGDDWVSYYRHYIVHGYSENREGADRSDVTHIALLDRNFTYVAGGYGGEVGVEVTDPADINALCNLIESIEVRERAVEPYDPNVPVVAGHYMFTLGNREFSMIGDEIDCYGNWRFVDRNDYLRIKDAIENLKQKYQ